MGTGLVAEKIRPATGVGEDAEKVDYPAAYIELISKSTGDSLGTYLVWVHDPLSEQTDRSRAGGHTTSRCDSSGIYHPFSIALKEFDYRHYTGTEHGEELFIARGVEGSGAERRPRITHLDEQPAALRGKHSLPVELP